MTERDSKIPFLRRQRRTSEAQRERTYKIPRAQRALPTGEKENDDMWIEFSLKTKRGGGLSNGAGGALKC